MKCDKGYIQSRICNGPKNASQQGWSVFLLTEYWTCAETCFILIYIALCKAVLRNTFREKNPVFENFTEKLLGSKYIPFHRYDLYYCDVIVLRL